MTILETLAFEASRDILEKNLQIYHPDIVGKKVVLIYDLDSPLSTLMANGYMENLKSYPNAETIEYGTISSADLKEKILSLEAYATVIMVESTNFRLEEFRIRMSLQHRNVAGIEHNHLTYIRPDQIETYLRAVSYQTPYFQKVSDFLKAKNDNGKVMKIISPE